MISWSKGPSALFSCACMGWIKNVRKKRTKIADADFIGWVLDF